MINLKNLIDFLPFEFKEQDTYKVDGKGILEKISRNMWQLFPRRYN